MKTLKAGAILEYLKGVNPETPVVIYDGENGGEAWDCCCVGHYTSANLYDDTTDTKPDIRCPHDGASIIQDLAEDDLGVVVFANIVEDECMMLVSE